MEWTEGDAGTVALLRIRESSLDQYRARFTLSRARYRSRY
jgi:hypothetical protein